MEFKHAFDKYNLMLKNQLPLEMFFDSKKIFFCFRGPIKYFDLTPPELGWLDGGK